MRIPSGTPLPISLLEDVPADADGGLPLRFQVSRDLLIGDSLVIRKGAPVTGELVDKSKKKFLVKTTKPTFRLLQVTAADGSKLKVRATADGAAKSERQLDPHPAPPKDFAAKTGDEFIGYVDGAQDVTIKR